MESNKTGLHKIKGGWSKTEQRMEEAIFEVVDSIFQLELNRAILSFENKIDSCLEAEGGQLEYRC